MSEKKKLTGHSLYEEMNGIGDDLLARSEAARASEHLMGQEFVEAESGKHRTGAPSGAGTRNGKSAQERKAAGKSRGVRRILRTALAVAAGLLLFAGIAGAVKIYSTGRVTGSNTAMESAAAVMEVAEAVEEEASEEVAPESAAVDEIAPEEAYGAESKTDTADITQEEKNVPAEAAAVETGSLNREAQIAVNAAAYINAAALSPAEGGESDSGNKAEEVSPDAGAEAFSKKALTVFLGENAAGNAVCAPSSLYVTLSALSGLTDGTTKEEILVVLEADDEETLAENTRAITESTTYAGETGESLLTNSLWVGEDTTIYNEETLTEVAQLYNTSTFSGEMGSEEYNTLLTAWANVMTGGGEETDSLTFSEDTRLASLSAVDYSAAWQSAFSPETTAAVFRTERGETEVNMMHQWLAGTYYAGEGFGAVALLLSDGNRMWFFLPDEGVTPESIFSGEDCYEIIRHAETYEQRAEVTIKLGVPSFAISETLDLGHGLRTLGISEIYTEDADFSGLLAENYDGTLSLTKAAQTIRIAIGEAGIGMDSEVPAEVPEETEKPAQIVEFLLDKPFGFALASEDGLIWYAGVVNTP